jgi:hypothetical protein
MRITLSNTSHITGFTWELHSTASWLYIARDGLWETFLEPHSKTITIENTSQEQQIHNRKILLTPFTSQDLHENYTALQADYTSPKTITIESTLKEQQNWILKKTRNTFYITGPPRELHSPTSWLYVTRDGLRKAFWGEHKHAKATRGTIITLVSLSPTQYGRQNGTFLTNVCCWSWL